MKPAAAWCVAAVLSAGSTAALAHGDKIHDDESALQAEPIVLAPGYENLDYPAPVPGSYTLGDLGAAGDGNVLNTRGRVQRLHDLLESKVTVLSFIYRACNDVNGCPLATFVLNQIRHKLADDVDLAGTDLAQQVQLLSMSFDPANDTPDSMAEYAASFGEGEIDWHFLTSASESELQSVLAAYDQSIQRTTEPVASQGRELESSTVINHLLRVYVIDQHKRIRNIYNSSLLHADTLIADIKTLLLPAQAAGGAGLEVQKTPASSVAPGGGILADDRSGYASGDYVSRTTRLQSTGEAADLLALARKPVAGLPPLPVLDTLDKVQVELGRLLFFDRRLSINNTFSCAMCHAPEQSFTVNELATAVGVEGRTVRRNAPSLLNVGYMSRLFHDGREFSLEQQAWSPLLAHNEMANPSIGFVVNKLAAIPEYRQRFARAFGDATPDMATIGAALAAYQRVLVAGNSPFDQWFYSARQDAVDDSVKAGFELFRGKAGCAGCHTVGSEHALFSDNQMHNTGIGYTRSMRKNTEPHPVTLAPGVVVMVDPAVYASAAEKPPNDLGLYEITQNPADRWKYRTPGLRNVALTAPYMHDGSLATLEDVIDFYDAGGVPNPELSPLIRPLGLSAGERSALVAFLRSLNSDAVTVLIRDARAVPVGDVANSDPDWRKAYIQ